MSNDFKNKTLREILAENGDLRRKTQCAAAVAAFNVLKEAGYTITSKDVEEMKADHTAMAIALQDNFDNESKGDNLPEVIIASAIGAAIASGGF
jgi:hypothetical protein